jgi:FMN phosphatase YigB (HAD superfamily)
VIRAILFDAAGTLFFLTKTVGHHYAYVGCEVGLDLDAQELDHAFHTAWKQMPQRPAIDGPRENDDKDWWRELVGRVFDQVAPALSEFDRDTFFEVAYEHFAEPGIWQLYP